MHHDYDDIRTRIHESPKWFDENAVPRYDTFGPDNIADIYAREAALVEIACQSCQTKFHVAFARSTMDDVMTRMRGHTPKTLSDVIRAKTIHYGDPPNIRCCPAGPTMNSDPLRVLEYWRKDEETEWDWKRDAAFEIDVSDDEPASVQS